MLDFRSHTLRRAIHEFWRAYLFFRTFMQTTKESWVFSLRVKNAKRVIEVIGCHNMSYIYIYMYIYIYASYRSYGLVCFCTSWDFMIACWVMILKLFQEFAQIQTRPGDEQCLNQLQGVSLCCCSMLKLHLLVRLIHWIQAINITCWTTQFRQFLNTLARVYSDPFEWPIELMPALIALPIIFNVLNSPNPNWFVPPQ